MKYQHVMLDIEVPVGKHCCKGGEVPCEYLDVHGFNTGCSLGMGRPVEDKNGWQLKPEKCLELKIITD